MLYVKVMDTTCEAKFLLFDSIASQVVGETAATILGGALLEVIFY